MYRLPKRLFYSIGILLLWLSFVVEGSHALFTSAATLSGNTINSGTASLQVSASQDPNPTDFSASQPGFTYTLVPGQSDSRFVTLKNASSDDVPMDIDVTTPNLNNTIASSLSNSVTISLTPVDANGVANGAEVRSTLAPLTTQPIHTGLTLASGSTQRFTLKTTLSSDYTVQNQSLAYDLTFTGLQHYAP